MCSVGIIIHYPGVCILCRMCLSDIRRWTFVLRHLSFILGHSSLNSVIIPSPMLYLLFYLLLCKALFCGLMGKIKQLIV
jgi:hypothetical protein